MIHPKKTVKSFGYAGRGLSAAWREEHNFRLEVLFALLAIALATLLQLDAVRFSIIVLSCGFVLALELVNTMIEQISDLMKPRLDERVQKIKDLTAAAVLVASLAALIVGLSILLPAALVFSWQ